MRFLLILTIILQGFSGYSQSTIYTLLKPKNGNQIRSIAISEANNLFIAQTNGEMGLIHHIDTHDSILHTKVFSAKGRVSVDPNGNLGVFYGENNKFWFFNQKDLTVLDSVNLPLLNGEIKVFFTNQGVLLGGVNSTFLYKNGKVRELTELRSYKIFDVHPVTNDLLLGYWDNNIASDVKIRKMFYSNLNLLSDKTHLFTTEMYNLYSYFMNNGMKVIAIDGGSKVYMYDFVEKQVQVIINDNGLFSTIKFSDNLMGVVTTYRGSKDFNKHQASSISLVDVNSGKITKSYDIPKRPTASDLVINKSNGIIYFTTTNYELIVIRN